MADKRFCLLNSEQWMSQVFFFTAAVTAITAGNYPDGKQCVVKKYKMTELINRCFEQEATMAPT